MILQITKLTDDEGHAVYWELLDDGESVRAVCFEAFESPEQAEADFDLLLEQLEGGFHVRHNTVAEQDCPTDRAAARVSVADPAGCKHDLRRCAFCGSDDLRIEDPIGDSEALDVIEGCVLCWDCGATGPSKTTTAEVVAAWNERS